MFRSNHKMREISERIFDGQTAIEKSTLRRAFFELSVLDGTRSTPSVREAMLRIMKHLRRYAHLTSHRA